MVAIANIRRGEGEFVEGLGLFPFLFFMPSTFLNHSSVMLQVLRQGRGRTGYDFLYNSPVGDPFSPSKNDKPG